MSDTQETEIRFLPTGLRSLKNWLVVFLTGITYNGLYAIFGISRMWFESTMPDLNKVRYVDCPMLVWEFRCDRSLREFDSRLSTLSELNLCGHGAALKKQKTQFDPASSGFRLLILE